MEKLNFAIIGCGRIASRHADIILKHAQLSAVCDIKPDRARNFAEKNSKHSECKAYDNIDELLKQEKNLHVIVVCTPNSLHKEHTVKSLNAGKHVLCEKPMAISVSDCLEMISAEERTGKKLLIVKQNRFNPPVVALKEVIDSGKLGKIFNIQLNCFWNRTDKYYKASDWKGKKALDGGTLFTQFSHFIDLIYWIGGDISDVFSVTGNFLHNKTIEFEDTGAVILKFKSGALGTINFTVNSYKKNMEGSITVFGEKGTVKVGGQYLNVLEYQSIDDYKITGLPESRPPNEYGLYQGSMSNHDKVYENLFDVIHNNAPVAVNAYEGMKTVEIIEKIYESS